MGMLSCWFACLLLLLLRDGPNGSVARPTAARLMIPVPVEGEKRIAKRHADFEQVRTRLTKDHSGAGGDPPQKYFHEATFHPHYDGRFADRTLPDHLRHTALTHLVQTYLSAMASIGAETWLMHGSLLGWWWNRAIMPWDSDIDVQMSVESMRFLAAYHNMTVHHFWLPDGSHTHQAEETNGAVEVGAEHMDEMEKEVAGERKARDYLLEINPNWWNGSTADTLNVIDARWIDTETGLFIDITTLRPNFTARAEGVDGAMMCKDKHHYLEQDIFPLRDSTFEKIPVKIPYAYSELLEEEYGRKSLTKTVFEGHVWDEEKQEWRAMFQHEIAAQKEAERQSKHGYINLHPALPHGYSRPYGRGTDVKSS